MGKLQREIMCVDKSFISEEGYKLVLKHRTMVIKEELFTCIHICVQVIQQVKHII